MKVTITEINATAILQNFKLPVFACLKFDQVWSWRTKESVCESQKVLLEI